MPKSKSSKRSKKSTSKYTFPRLFSGKSSIMFFAAAFALIGSYYVYKSYASRLPVPQGEKTLIERRNTFETMPDGDRLVDNETISFRLYEGGLAICGGYSDGAHPERYYSTQLSPAQKNKFLNEIAQTGFTDIQTSDSGTFGIVVTAAYQQLSVLKNDVGKTVSIDPQTPKPPAYERTNALIDSLCRTITTVYQPPEIEITTKEVDSNIPADGGTLPEVGVTVNKKVSKKKLKNSEARKLQSSLGKTGKKVFKKGNKTVEVRAEEVLPPTVPIQNSISSGIKSLKLSGSPSLISSSKVSAAVPPIEVYRFCATDICNINQNPGQHVSAASEFYKRNIKQKMNIKAAGRYRGKHTSAWYKTCHGYIHPCTADRRPLHNVLENLTHEIKNEAGWSYDRPRIFILGFETGDLAWCGLAYKGPGGLQTAVDENTGTCATGYHKFVTTTHELGHLFGLSHMNDNNYDLMRSSSACILAGSINNCKVNILQAAWLIRNSTWLSPI